MRRVAGVAGSSSEEGPQRLADALEHVNLLLVERTDPLVLHVERRHDSPFSKGGLCRRQARGYSG